MTEIESDQSFADRFDCDVHALARRAERRGGAWGAIALQLDAIERQCRAFMHSDDLAAIDDPTTGRAALRAREGRG